MKDSGTKEQRKQLGASLKAKKELLDHLKGKLSEDGPSVDAETRELLQTVLRFGELRLATLPAHLEAIEQALDSFATLGKAALDDGDAFAVDRLVDLTRYAVTVLEAVCAKRPDLVRPLARQAVEWPVMANLDPDWPAQVRTKLQTELQLGEDTIHGQLDASKAYNLANVSRRYARGIVDTLEINRCCAAYLEERKQIIKSKHERDGARISVPKIPGWFWEAAKLEPFGPGTADAWLEVGIEMLKEQGPDLPQGTDWARIKEQWKKRGETPTPGRLWGRINDALHSPMKTISRAHHQKGDTQIRLPDLGIPNCGTKKA